MCTNYKPHYDPNELNPIRCLMHRIKWDFHFTAVHMGASQQKKVRGVNAIPIANGRFVFFFPIAILCSQCHKLNHKSTNPSPVHTAHLRWPVEFDAVMPYYHTCAVSATQWHYPETYLYEAQGNISTAQGPCTSSHQRWRNTSRPGESV